MKKSFSDNGRDITGRCRHGADPLSPRWEGVVAMGIPCADSAIATMDDQLRLLIGANASTELYRLALGRRNEGGTTCPFTLNPPIAIRTLRNELIPAFHNHPTVGTDGLARVAVELQVVGIGPGPAGARHDRLVVRRARDDEALRARGIRRPAQQNAQAGHGGKHLAVPFNEKANRYNRVCLNIA
mgnify:CR=1 FL=1